MQATSAVAWQWHTRRPLLRALDVLALTVTFGIGAALVHVAELAIARFVQGELVWFSRDFLWMSPIAYTLVLLPGGILLSLLALVSGSRWVLALSTLAVVAAAVFGVLLPYSQIARAISLFLAVAVAVQLTRLTLSSPNKMLRFTRRAAVAGTIVVAALALLMPPLRGWRETRSVASLTGASQDAPNILVIILDTVRAASFGLYKGAPATTPRLLEWAREGVVFDNAYAPAPWTLPSHGSFFTGRYPGELEADWKIPLGNTDSTLAEALRARGYATGAFVGNMHYTSWDSGLKRGFGAYHDYRRTWNQTLLSSSYTQTRLFRQLRNARSLGGAFRALRNSDLSIDIKHTFDHKRAHEISRSFLDWQTSLAGRPFFAFLNYFDAHRPYYAPQEFRTFPKQAIDIHVYHGAIAWLDSQIDALLDTLRSRGVLDKTLVIVTSDHGELFEEHGLSGHAHNLYRNVLWVPLFVRYPARVPSNVRVDATISLRDLPATVADLASLRHTPFPGTSLAATWSATGGVSPVIAEVRRAPNVTGRYPTSRGAMTSLTDSVGHYIRNGDGSENLFTWRSDSAETRDLAEGSGAAERLAPWRARLDSVLQARKAPNR
ncbi:MAG: sulfatase [Gemmatimonadaceae bacterium]